MAVSLRLSTPDPTDDEALSRFLAVAAEAAAADGYDPFNEQARIDLAAGRRSPVLAELSGEAVAGALIGQGELDLVVLPGRRGRGIGTAVLDRMLRELPAAPLTAWSHGDHPAARALAASHGFSAVRTLLSLRLPGLAGAGETEAPAEAETEASGVRLGSFVLGQDEAEWVRLNADVFASHPEQGRITLQDVRAREAEEWFDPADFLVLRDEHARMIGYNWLKVEPGSPAGEIYAIGVEPASAGCGFGRLLMLAGQRRLRERGCREATLYVEADNAPALALYRSLGFADDTIDVQYRRPG